MLYSTAIFSHKVFHSGYNLPFILSHSDIKVLPLTILSPKHPHLNFGSTIGSHIIGLYNLFANLVLQKSTSVCSGLNHTYCCILEQHCNNNLY